MIIFLVVIKVLWSCNSCDKELLWSCDKGIMVIVLILRRCMLNFISAYDESILLL